MIEKEVAEKFPLHYHVWQNDYLALEEVLLNKTHDVETTDPHGRTPLLLGIMLDHLESVRVLLRHNANACGTTKDYWSITQEAVSTGDPELVKLVLTHRDSHMLKHQAKLITSLLNKLKETPDFYIEIKWEFTSWLPLVSRMCPSDLCRVWKQGPNVRIDASLIGFSGTSSWVRGNLSYIFRVTEKGVQMDEVNHSDRTIYRHSISSLVSAETSRGGGAGASANSILRAPSDDLVAKKLTQPTFVTFIDTAKIEFTKNKSGILGWGADRKETVNGHECHVCSAANVQIVTLRRTEHLTDENLRAFHESKAANVDSVDPAAAGGSSANLLTGLLTSHGAEKVNITKVTNEAASYNPRNISIEDYFSQDVGVTPVFEIGRPKVMTAKSKTYKVRLWLCEAYPISLKNQLLPIVDLMSEYNPYFHKLKEFLTKQLPTGFPMKVEIPLYHILNAQVTFGNLHGSDSPAYGVTCNSGDEVAGKSDPAGNAKAEKSIGESRIPSTPDGEGVPSRTCASEPTSCIVNDCVFDIGQGYRLIEENSPGHFGTIDEEEQLVQMAVQRSLMEYGGANHLMQREFSLRKRSVVETRPGECVDPEEAMMQEAIADSFQDESGLSDLEQAYLKALEISRTEVDQEEERRRKEEEELDRVLKLSMLEK